MTTLQELLTNTYKSGYNDGTRRMYHPETDEVKQQIKDLMLELATKASFTAAKAAGFSQKNAYGGMDALRNELRQKVNEL
jgi:hypothetical protein